MLKGLAYLHAKEIVHRDLKVGNLLLNNKGTVKVGMSLQYVISGLNKNL